MREEDVQQYLRFFHYYRTHRSSCSYLIQFHCPSFMTHTLSSVSDLNSGVYLCVFVCVQEVLESCQTRVSKLELQQQQQQTVQVENTDAKVLLGKCINIMLAIVTVILVCVSTAAKFTAPLLRSRLHLALTCVGVSVLALLWKNWEHLQCALERLVLPHWFRSTNETRKLQKWTRVHEVRRHGNGKTGEEFTCSLTPALVPQRF